MRIRGILVTALLFSALIPSAFFGYWAYQDGVDREFSEVSDRHLLLAKNLGSALERYHIDLVAISESVIDSMISWQDFPSITQTLQDLHIESIILADKKTGKIISKLEHTFTPVSHLPKNLIDELSKIANSENTTFSPVMASGDDKNIMYAVKSHGGWIAITKITTDYFVKLGESISFGVKGHAAIVDNAGNVLAHPLASWIKARKNITKVSAVKRMLNGETGIEQFYSPALKGDMIAGLTAVKGPGWGVMIPQPVVELYDNAAIANRSIFRALSIGVLISFLVAFAILKFLAKPLQKVVDVFQDNAENAQLKEIHLPNAILKVSELREFHDSYNAMVHTIGEANKEMEILAYTDSVTKLPNGMRFQQIGDNIVSGKVETEFSDGSIILVDVDNFKAVNDLHGHAVGDQLLKRIAENLSTAASEYSKSNYVTEEISKHSMPVVSRTGGNEFAILMPGLTAQIEIINFSNSILDIIQFESESAGISVDCSAGIGIATYPKDVVKVSEIIRLADIAMNTAKNDGKNRVQIYNPELGKLSENEIRSKFSSAIETDQLVLEYQPKICTRRKAVYGVEALVRWDHPMHGRLFPDSWLPAIAQTSLMLELGYWVVDKAMTDIVKWQKNGMDLNVAVNISADQLHDPKLVSVIADSLKKHNVKPENFEIEITEDTLFANTNSTSNILAKVKALGIKISIDDFGKGYSNLSRLTQLPIDFIKLDRSIVSAGVTDPKVNIILNSTIDMAKQLDYKIVAEGIEDLEMAKFATAISADLLQGFYFSKSLPAEKLISWIETDSFELLQKYKTVSVSEAA